MNAKWFGVALLAALAVGCGVGRAIFNVDVYSFLQGTGRDTVPYFVPASTSLDTSSVQHINLPGAGSSIVDTVHAIGGVKFLNTGGSGTIRFQLYVAADSLGTYNASALAVSVPAPPAGPAPVPGPPVGIDADLANAVNSAFTQSELWVRLVAQVSAAAGLPMQGQMVLDSLRLHIVVRDKVF
jgi:hypothetical protein